MPGFETVFDKSVGVSSCIGSATIPCGVRAVSSFVFPGSPGGGEVVVRVFVRVIIECGVECEPEEGSSRMIVFAPGVCSPGALAGMHRTRPLGGRPSRAGGCGAGAVRPS